MATRTYSSWNSAEKGVMPVVFPPSATAASGYSVFLKLSPVPSSTPCAHKVVCSVDNVASYINYRSHSFCVAGERGYDAEELHNLKNVHEPLPRRLNGHEHYNSHLTTVVPGEDGEEVRVVLKL